VAARGQQLPQVHLFDQVFTPSDFLLEFQEDIHRMVSHGPDPSPTLAPRYELKEPFISLITDGPGKHALLVRYLKPVLRQLIACQMYRLEPYHMLVVGVFIMLTLCAEVMAFFSMLIEAQRAQGLLDVFAVLLVLQDLVDAYHNTRSALPMRNEMDSVKSRPHNGSSVPLAKKFSEDFFWLEQVTEQDTRLEVDTAN